MTASFRNSLERRASWLVAFCLPASFVRAREPVVAGSLKHPLTANQAPKLIVRRDGIEGVAPSRRLSRKGLPGIRILSRNCSRVELRQQPFRVVNLSLSNPPFVWVGSVFHGSNHGAGNAGSVQKVFGEVRNV